MHAVVMESLEEYLAGALNPAAQRDIEAHLTSCDTCREEIRSMQDVSQLFLSLRPEVAVFPAPGFYARVTEQVSGRVNAPSVANVFGLGFAFGRRLIFASVLMLAVLGSYLVVHESGYAAGPSPEAVMAQQESPAFDSASAQDNMLVTLTAYEH
jgi:anti-sigma factor RsiW